MVGGGFIRAIAEFLFAYITAVIVIKIATFCKLNITKIAQMIRIFINAVNYWQSTIVTNVGAVCVNAAAGGTAYVTGMIPGGINRTPRRLLATGVTKVIAVDINAGSDYFVTLVASVIVVIIIALSRVIAPAQCNKQENGHKDDGGRLYFTVNRLGHHFWSTLCGF